MPPFGFGLSMPNLRKAAGAAPFVPTVLVTENWSGSGLVDGKVPTTGGGTWVASASMDYSSGIANPGVDFAPTAYHSETYTNARFTGVTYAGILFPSTNQPVYLYARADINTGFPTNCYYVTRNASPTNIVLVKRVSSNDTTLGTFEINSNGLPIGLEVSGSAIKVYANGAVVISVTDSSITAAGYWGFGLTYGESGEETGNSSMGPITIQTA